MIRRKNILEVDLGRTEFAGMRRDIPLADRGERDTEVERNLWVALTGWVDAEVQPGPDVIATLRAAMSHPVYSRFFAAPPQSALLYRGFSVTRERLESWIGYDPTEVKRGWEGEPGSWTFRSRSADAPFTSYSYSPDAAESFSRRGSGEYRIVVQARAGDSPDSFLDLHDMTTRLDPDAFSVDTDVEMEVTAIGPVNVKVLWWARRDVLPDEGWGGVRP